MKKITLIAITIIISNIVFSQPQRTIKNTDNGVQNGDYLIGEDVSQYLGTWEWKSGDDTFTIILTKKEKLLIEINNFIFYSDMIIGWHQYTRKGNKVETSMDSQNLSISNGEEALLNSTLNGGAKQTPYLSLTVVGLNQNKKGTVKLTINESSTELHWKVFVHQSSYPMKQEKFTLPVDIIMKKVK